MTSNSLSFRDEFQLKYFGYKECQPRCFSRLQWTGNRKLHVIYRLFMSLYCIGWFIADLVLNVDPFYITFLTHWGQIVMISYFCCALLIAIFTHSNDTAPGPSSMRREEVEPSLRWFHVVTWALLNMYVTIAVMITISYWVGVGEDLIEPAKSVLSANVHVHVINTVLAFIEMTLNDLPVRILHFYWPIAFGVVYVFFTLILHWSNTLSVVYALLNWRDNPGVAAGLALGLLIVAVPLFHFIITWGSYRLRVFMWKKYVKKEKTQIELQGNINDICDNNI